MRRRCWTSRCTFNWRSLADTLGPVPFVVSIRETGSDGWRGVTHEDLAQLAQRGWTVLVTQCRRAGRVSRRPSASHPRHGWHATGNAPCRKQPMALHRPPAPALPPARHLLQRLHPHPQHVNGADLPHHRHPPGLAITLTRRPKQSATVPVNVAHRCPEFPGRCSRCMADRRRRHRALGSPWSQQTEARRAGTFMPWRCDTVPQLPLPPTQHGSL